MVLQFKYKVKRQLSLFFLDFAKVRFILIFALSFLLGRNI